MSHLPSSSRGVLSVLRSPSLPGPSTATATATRTFSTTPLLNAKPRRTRTRNDPLALNRMKAYNYDDVPTQGHFKIQRQRELLKYYRIAVNEMPKLQQFRQTYVPPSPQSFVRYRFVHFQGEGHPLTRKVVLTVPVSSLFSSGVLASPAAQHKFLLLAGNRYDSNTGRGLPLPLLSASGGLDTLQSEAGKKQTKEGGEELGVVKISSEHLPNEAQNVKWCADKLDEMIAEANTNPEQFSALPLDRRHELVREAKRGGFKRRNSASIRDFPQEWL